MTSRIADAVLRLPVLSRPRRARLRKPSERPAGAPSAPQPRPARAPRMLTLSVRRVERRNRA